MALKGRKEQLSFFSTGSRGRSASAAWHGGREVGREHHHLPASPMQVVDDIKDVQGEDQKNYNEEKEEKSCVSILANLRRTRHIGMCRCLRPHGLHRQGA